MSNPSDPSEPVRIEVESVVDAIEESEGKTTGPVDPEPEKPNTIVVEPVNGDEKTG